MRRLALVAFFLATTGAQAAVLCPAMRDGHPLRGANMYSGPPSEGAILKPDQEGQRVWYETSGGSTTLPPDYLVCDYARDAPGIVVKVPAEARECTLLLTQDEQISGAVECH